MARLRVDTENDTFGAYEIEEGDKGLFLLDDNGNRVGYVPYGRLRVVRKNDE